MPAPVDDPPCDVSFVVTSRNDDFGGRMLPRLRFHAENLLQLANRHGLRGELIVVDWNPPPGPRLSDVLKLETVSDIFAVRFIEAPPSAHARLRNADVLPLFQMIAKNVGIRRARGRFVCATNQDILFSDELIAHLASGRLDPGVMYRLDRTDVAADVPDRSADAQIAWCRRNVLRVNGRLGTFRYAWWTAAGLRDYLLDPGWREALRKRLRLRRTSNPLRAGAFLARGVLRTLFAGLARVLDPTPRVHTNACGDFTLMAREHWDRLRGYPELELYSLHIDSLLCLMAVATGVEERVLPAPQQIFHLEHGSSWAVLNSEERLRWFAAKPWIEYAVVEQLWGDMLRTRTAVQFNPPEWGLGGLELKEVVLLDGRRRVVEAGPAPAAAA